MTERRLAAVMVMDVVGYSRLMGADELGTLAALSAHRRELIDPAVAAHHGRLVKTTGDGLLLEFASVVDAIACAVAIQRGLLSRNEQVPESRRLVFRIGVNIGDIIVDGNDIFGDGVNVAARLESLCDPGGVCISRAANEQVRDRLSLAFADLGEHTVKNIARSVGVFGLRAADIAALPESPLGQLQLEAAARAHRRRRKAAVALAACVVVALGVTAGATWWISRGATGNFEQDVMTGLAESVPGAFPKFRQNMAAAFMKAEPHRAIAVAPRAGGIWWTGEWSTRQIAEEKVLEKCQQFYDEPCAVIAADDAIAPARANGSRPIRDMPRVHYTGRFKPDQLPAVSETARERPDILGYARVAGPKAIAFHAKGIVYVVTGAPSQRAAEEQALRACNHDPALGNAPSPCYLYAVENKVVLPLRSTTPITPAPAAVSSTSPPQAAALPVPAATAGASSALSAAAAFSTALRDVITKIAPWYSAGALEAQIVGYQNSSDHKAIAVSPPSGSWRIFGWGDPTTAEERALEGCEARYGKPCVLAAVDEAVQVPLPDGEWPRGAMPRVEYAGLFDPQQIPAATEALRQRSDVAGYREKQGAKAAAFHPWGRIFIATGGMTQREAEEQALADCNEDLQRKGRDGPCFLYAVGDHVVLPKRLTSPLTAASRP
jgi:class 3 adenylate cyclase